ncbi:MAG: WD40 repeat domain-containing protein, partial [bacterium]
MFLLSCEIHKESNSCEIHKESNKPFYFKSYGPLRPILGLLRLWDVAADREARILSDDNSRLSSLRFSPDGRWLVSAIVYAAPEDEEGLMSALSGQKKLRRAEVKLWDASTGKLLQTLPQRAMFIGSLTFSPDGRWLAIGEEAIWLWDPIARREV